MAAQTNRWQAPNLPGGESLTSPETEHLRTNVLRMGLRISTDFDDNALNSNQNRKANLVTSIQPRLGWHLVGARINWVADYTPGLSRSQSFSAYDSFSHQFESSVQLKLTRRLLIRAHETFLKTTNPFEQLRLSESATGAAPRSVPNDIVPATSAEVRTEQASFAMVYMASAHSTAGVVGEFNGANYSLRPAVSLSNRLFQNSHSVSGHGYYTLQVTRHQWTGFDYHLQRLVFNSGQSSLLAHSLVYAHTIALSSPMSLSFFVGPELSVTGNTAGALSLSPVLARHRSTWRLSGGATARWSGMRTSVIGRVARTAGDGGILGAARLSNISVELRRQFARRWTVNALASYDDIKALAAPGALSYASAAGGLTRTLGPNLSIESQYWRAHLSSRGSLPSAFLADHNRMSVSLIYDFRLPLAR